VRRDRGRRDKASGTLLLKDGTNRLHANALFCVQGGSGRINDLSLEQWRKIQSVNYDSVLDGTNRLHRVKDAVVVDRLDLAPLLEREVVDPARAALYRQRESA
jgi:hypothetical protein